MGGSCDRGLTACGGVGAEGGFWRVSTHALQKREMATTGKRQREGAGGGEGGSGKRGSAAQQQQQDPAGSDGRGQELPGVLDLGIGREGDVDV